jgi:hypothetical protein
MDDRTEKSKISMDSGNHRTLLKVTKEDLIK